MKASFAAGVEYHGKIYYSENWLNAFCSFDLKTQEVRFIKLFDKEKLRGGLFRNAVLYKEKVWFVPAKAEHVVCVDLRTLEMKYYDIPYKKNNWFDDEGRERDYLVYSQIKLVGKSILYCLPFDIDTMLKIDLETEQFTPIYEVQLCNDRKHRLTTVQPWEDKLLLFYRDKLDCPSLLLKDGRKSDITYKLSVPGLYVDAVCIDARIYLKRKAPNEIVIFEPEKKIETVDVSDYEGWHNGSISNGNEILYFPVEAQTFLLFGVKDKKVESLNYKYIDNSEAIYTTENNRMNMISSENGRVLLTTGYTGCIIEFVDDYKYPEIIIMEFSEREFLRNYCYACKERGEKFYINSFVNEGESRGDYLWSVANGGNFEAWLTGVRLKYRI